MKLNSDILNPSLLYVIEVWDVCTCRDNHLVLHNDAQSRSTTTVPASWVCTQAGRIRGGRCELRALKRGVCVRPVSVNSVCSSAALVGSDCGVAQSSRRWSGGASRGSWQARCSWDFSQSSLRWRSVTGSWPIPTVLASGQCCGRLVAFRSANDGEVKTRWLRACCLPLV